MDSGDETSKSYNEDDLCEDEHIFEGGRCLECGIFCDCNLCGNQLTDINGCEHCEDGVYLCDNCVSRCELCDETICNVCKERGNCNYFSSDEEEND